MKRVALRRVISSIALLLILAGATAYSLGERSSLVSPVPLQTEQAFYPAGPFAYDFSKVQFALPFDALFGTREQFAKWQEDARKEYIAQFKAVPLPMMAEHRLENSAEALPDKDAAYTLKRVVLSLPGIDEQYGGLLAVPKTLDPAKPLLIAIHGHEEKDWGMPAVANFTGRGWMHALAEQGFLVYAPVSMYHKQIDSLAGAHGHPLVWARLVSDSIDFLQPTVFEAYPHAGLAVVGLSSGAVTAWFLTAARPDITSTVVAGATQPLDFLRRTYRIKDHPNCWDVAWLDSYTSIQALAAPRPVMIMEGREDSFFPRLQAFERNSWFSGSDRGVLLEEFAGQLLILEHLWTLTGARRNLAIAVHGGGASFHSGTGGFLSQGRAERRFSLEGLR